MEKSMYCEAFDDTAFEQVFQRYSPVVYNIQSRYYIRDFDQDDWLQEGRIALNDALTSYQQDRGTTFGLYYKMIFENRIRSLLRRQQAKKRLAQQQAVSIEKVGSDSFSERFLYHEFVEENICISEMFLTGEIELSDLEKRALYYYLKGEARGMIAHHVKESEKTVQNALNRAKNKIKKGIYTKAQ